jgi:acyl-CoA synthetase (NDP forming)/GNAT superfamily N-acetyltransferase
VRRESAPSDGPAGARLVRDVLLRDGTTMRLESTRPEDYEEIRAFYDALSSESRYFRFHGYGRTEVLARMEADATGADRLAVIARHGDRVVAAASYDGLREPGVAEVAFAVADEYQHRGIGMRMLEQLAAVAAERGIHRFDAEVMAANRSMLGVFEDAGFAIRRQGFSGEVTVSLDITPTPALQEQIDERDHRAAVASLRSILAPTSVAVMGAAAEPENVGHAVLQNIIAGGFSGLVVPVHPRGGVVCSMPAARSLAELRTPPELVIIAASGRLMLGFAAEAAQAGARALLVLPAEYGDGAARAREYEAELLEIVRNAGMRMIGPNSLGLLNTAAPVSLNATAAGVQVSAGGLAVCSPSGAVGLGLLGYAVARHLGISMFTSLGDRCDVSTNDLLECWEEDERTVAAILYVETFGNPEHFARIAQRVSRRKAILVVKGRRRADPVPDEIRSRTAGALRGEALVDALLHRAGILRFRSGEDLFNAAEFFGRQPLPSGRRVAIITNSSGVATLAVDAALNRGLELAAFADGRANPCVLPAVEGAEGYAAATRALLADPGVDALAVHYLDRRAGDAAAVLQQVSGAADATKPVVACVLRSDGRMPEHHGAGVPNYLFPEACSTVLARAADRRDWLSRPLGERPVYGDLDPAAARAVVVAHLERDPAQRWLTGADARAALRAYGIDVASDPDTAGSDGAGEVLVGSVADPDLGPVMAVGLGGRHAGLDGTAAFALLPATDAEADELFDSSPAVCTELDGFRGGPMLDRPALRELILRFSILLRDLPEVAEVDLNPVRCLPTGCHVLDVRMCVQRPHHADRVKTW